MSHPHQHHGAGCSHDHKDEKESAIQYSLYNRIDMNNLVCLNEAIQGSGKYVFKSWQDRLNKDKFVESDLDEELLFNIPFTGNVKLKGIIVIGEEQNSYPSKVRIFKNRPHMSFDDTQAEPEQTIILNLDTDGTLEYPTKIAKFSSVTHLSLHFPNNLGTGDETPTKIYYIGLKGEWSESQPHGVTNCVYETRPTITDHDVSAWDSVKFPPIF